jgi:hypothetical protein
VDLKGTAKILESLATLTAKISTTNPKPLTSNLNAKRHTLRPP